MGIGIALATGLVQGFTRNIQEEKAMRLGEQEKLDALNTIIAEAAVGNKNFNKANADKLGDMIKASQGKMDDRERINIFGQAAERVNVDFTGVLSTLSTAAAEDVYQTDFLGLKIPVPEKYSDYEGTNRGSSMLYEALNNYRINNGQNFNDHFVNNPDLFMEARNRMINLGKDALRYASSNVKGDMPYNVSVDELPGYNDYFNSFFNISKTAQYQNQWDVTKGIMEDRNSNISKNSALIPLSGSLFSGATRLDGEVIGYTKDDMIPSLWTDLEGMDEFRWSKIGETASIQGMDTGQFIFNFSKKYDNLEDFTTSLNVVADLAELGAAKGNARTGEDILAQGQYIATNPALKDDVYSQANVFMAFQPLAMSGSEQSMIDAGISPRVTVGKGENFKTQFENLIGITYAKFQTKMTGVIGARTKLSKYRSMVEKLPAPSGSVISDVYRIIDSIFGETGKIDQIVNIIGFGDDEYEGEGMAAFIEKDRERRGLDKGDLITATDALAYIIAADLARAEDDQGRLSDADIQRNLNKIKGFGATKKSGQLAAIDVVMATIKNQEDSLLAIDRIATTGMNTGEISRENRRFLAADKQARKARTMYMQSIAGMEFQTQESEQAMTAENLQGMQPVFDLNGITYYQPEGGGYFTLDSDGKVKEITEEDMLTAHKTYMGSTTSETPAEVDGQQMSGSAGAVNTQSSSQSAAAPTTAAGALLPDEQGNLSATQSDDMPADTSGSFASPADAATAVAQPNGDFDGLISATKLADRKPFMSGGYTAFYGLSKPSGKPRLFTRVVKEVNGQQRTFYREIK